MSATLVGWDMWMSALRLDLYATVTSNIVDFTQNVNSSVSQTIVYNTLYISMIYMIKLCISVEYLNSRIWQLNNNLLSSGILYQLEWRASSA